MEKEKVYMIFFSFWYYIHEKEKEIAAKDERYDKNVENAVARLDKNIKTVVILEMKRVSTMEDDDCVWMVLNEPPAPPSTVTAVAVSVVIGGCGPPPSILSFAVLEQQFVRP